MSRPIEHITEEKILQDFRDSFLEAASTLPDDDIKRSRFETAADHANRTLVTIRRINRTLERAMGLTPSGDTDEDYDWVDLNGDSHHSSGWMQAEDICPQCKGEGMTSCITPNCPICPQVCHCQEI